MSFQDDNIKTVALFFKHTADQIPMFERAVLTAIYQWQQRYTIDYGTPLADHVLDIHGFYHMSAKIISKYEIVFSKTIDSENILMIRVTNEVVTIWVRRFGINKMVHQYERTGGETDDIPYNVMGKSFFNFVKLLEQTMSKPKVALHGYLQTFFRNNEHALRVFQNSVVDVYTEWLQSELLTEVCGSLTKDKVDTLLGSIDVFNTAEVTMPSPDQLLISFRIDENGTDFIILNEPETLTVGLFANYKYFSKHVKPLSKCTLLPGSANNFIRLMLQAVINSLPGATATENDQSGEGEQPAEFCPDFVLDIASAASDTIKLLDRYREIMETLKQPAHVMAKMTIVEFNAVIKELQTLHENIGPNNIINAFLPD